jgi:hypothetical protein
MAFSPDELAQISDILDPWCEERVPIMVRDKLVLQYRVERHDVVLFEKRPAFRRPGEWTETFVAKFRFNRKTGLWSLLCRDRRMRWRRYDLVEPARDLEGLVQEVGRDPTGIFWG